MDNRADEMVRESNEAGIRRRSVIHGHSIYNPEDWNDTQLSTATRTVAVLKELGFTFLTSRESCDILETRPLRLQQLADSWNHLPQDPFLRDGGHYRYRRHSCFVQNQRSGAFTLVPHRAHWQSTQYNALHGGIDRLFAPIETPVCDAPAWAHLLGGIGRLFAQVHAVERWFIEAHKFRIDTAEGIGRPTPEGAHRDGVDFVAVILMGRRGVRGGETRVHSCDGRDAGRFTLREPGSMLLMNDGRVIHQTSPIHPTAPVGIRDTLVLTYRAHGFQSSL